MQPALRTPVFFIPGRTSAEQIAYAPLRRLAFSVNSAGEKILRALAGANGGLDAGLRQKPFLEAVERMGLLEELPDAPPGVAESTGGAYQPTTVTLFLTGNCNLHCSYCYARGGDTDSVMPWETAKAALDFVIDNAIATNSLKITVIFHGDGEPTLAWPILTKCIEYAERRCLEEDLACDFEAGMNGIIAEKRLRWLAPKLRNITVSLDGPPDIQDAQRPLSSPGGHERADSLIKGEGMEDERNSSSRIVERSLRILDELGVSYGIRCTITRRSAGRIPEVVEYLCKVSQTADLMLEPSFPEGRAIETDEREVDPAMFVDGFLQGRLIARQHGRRLKYAGARADQITNRFCEAVSGAFNVTQDGRVTSCYEVFAKDDPRIHHFDIGALDPATGRFGVNMDTIRAAAQWTAAEKAPCQGCFARYHCAGDCAAKLSATGDPKDTVNRNRCFVIRELTRAQIFSLYGFGDVTEPSTGWIPQDSPMPSTKLVQIRMA